MGGEKVAIAETNDAWAAQIALARRFFESWDEELNIVHEMMAPDYVYHSTQGDMDRDAYKQANLMYLSAFPDLQYTLDDIFAEGDKVVERWTMTGTHRGEIMGIPPTGKQVTMRGISTDRIRNGKFVDTWTYFDALGFLQQLGALPT